MKKNTGEQIIDYKVNMPKRGEVHAVKVLNDPQMLYYYLSSNEANFYSNDNFQRRYLYELPKLLWQTEKLEDLGDFVLLFPNPDKSIESEGAGISLADAEEYFRQIFDTNYNYPYKKKFMTALKEAFERAFIDLQDYKGDDAEVDGHDQDLDERAGLGPKGDTQSNENKKQVENQPKTPKSPKGDGQTPITFVKADRYNKAVASFLSNMIDEGLKGGSKRDDGSFKIPVDSSDSPVGSRRKMDHLTEKVIIQPNKASEGNKALPEKNTKFEKFEAKKKKKKKLIVKRKIIRGGGQYVDPNFSNSKLDQNVSASRKEAFDKNYSKYIWIKEKENTMDFLTLLRKTVLAVLASQGFITREIFIKDGEEIAVVLSLPEQNIDNVAMDIGIVKPMEISMVDLVSLEPVDSKFRPLRLSCYLWNLEDFDKAYIEKIDAAIEKIMQQKKGAQSIDEKKDFQARKDELDKEKSSIYKLRSDIHDLLANDCNMKQIVRFCDGIWHEEVNTNHESIYEHAEVELSDWYLYRNFLIELAIRISFIRLNYKKLKRSIDIFYEVNKKKVTRGNIPRKQLDLQDIQKFACREITQAFEMAKENSNSKKHLSSHVDESEDEDEEYEESPEFNLNSLSSNKETESNHKKLHQQKIKLLREQHKKISDGYELKGELKTIWDYMGISIPEYKAKLMNGNSKMRPRTRKFFNNLWKESIAYVDVFSKEIPNSSPTKSPGGNKRRSKSSIEYTKTIVDTLKEQNQNVAKICYSKYTKVDRLKTTHYLVGYL